MEKFYKEPITKDKLADYLTEKLPGLIITEITDDKIVGEYKGYEFEIDDKYNVTITGKASIKVTYTIEPQDYTKESVTISLSIELLEGGSVVSVTTQSNGVEVIEEKVKFKVTENGTYIFTVVDDKNNQKDIKIPIKNIDKEAPNATIELTEETIYRNSKIKAKVTIEDKESGVELANCKWIVNSSNTEIGTNVASYTGESITSEVQEIETGSMTTAGTYYIHVLATDKAGNVKETISSAVTVKNGYAISTPQDLQNMGNDLAGHYYIVNDIEMKGFTFNPIVGDFTGSIDGQGHTISNLTINSTTTAGIFTSISGNIEIKNLLLKEVNISAGTGSAGVIAPTCSVLTSAKFSKVGITGKVATGNSVVGAFLGTISQSSDSREAVSFENCYAIVDLNKTGTVWGSGRFRLSGFNSSSIIS